MAKKKRYFQEGKPKFSQNSEKGREKINPFELKVNRKKHDVIGRKSKAQYGTPGIHKVKINEKRRDFLKKTQLHRNKANDFIDRRIGENDSMMLKEDRIIARIAENQRKQHKKRLYNLNDDFDLTHLGEPISNMETFDDVENESDEDDDAQLTADFVSEAHFGGFLTKKDDTTPKTRKEILNEFIIESKRKKQDKKETKELNDDLTAKLDSDWKEIHSLLPEIKRNDSMTKTPCDPFDLTVKELKFDPRGTSVVVTKNEAIENEKKLRKLEEDRIRRMKGNNSVKKQKTKHVSIEAIDDDDGKFSESDAQENDELDENQLLQSDDTQINSENEDVNSGTIEKDNESRQSVEHLNLESMSLDEDYSVPQTIESFLDLISNLSSSDISLKIESLISSCRSTNVKNTRQLENFFRVLLEFVDFKFQDGCDDLQLLNVITPNLYTLAQKSVLGTGKIFRQFLLEKISLYEKKKCKKNFTFFNILIHLKLCSNLYSTSDFRHPIVILAMLLMSDILTSSFRTTFKNVVSRIFVCNLFYEYVYDSKRYVPEAVNYLFSVLSLSTDHESQFFNTINKLKLNNPQTAKIFLVTSAVENWEPFKLPLKLLMEDMSSESEISNILAVIYCVIILVHKFAELYENLPVFSELFRPATDLCSYLPIELYPTSLVTVIRELKNFVVKDREPLKYLTIPNKKPKLPKLFTPRIDHINEKEPSNILEKLKVHKQLSQKVKKEERSVMRELRRDTEFEAREQLRFRTEADSERKKKVKELCAQLANQEGEFKRLSKKK